MCFDDVATGLCTMDSKADGLISVAGSFDAATQPACDIGCIPPASADLMKSSPELMTEALNLHNGMMRKVRWENCGFTVEQEGDSYTFVFYTAVDAAVFCLQVRAPCQHEV